MATPVRIKIGASVDASMERAFSTFEKRAQKAAAAAQKALSGAGRGMLKDVDAAARAQEKGQERVAKAGKRAAADWAKALRQVGKVAEQELNRQARAQHRAATQQQRESRRFAERTSHRASRFFWPNAPLGSMAGRMGRDISRGLGIDFNLGTGLERSVQMERSATQLSNQAYQRGAAGPAGVRQDPRQIIAEARKVGDDLALDPTELIAGLQQFTDLTGNLQLGRDVLAQTSALAAATGSSLEDMAAASGNVANQLEDTPDKAQRIARVMQVIAGQGKLGAVEIKDLATHMARVASQVKFFEGDEAENIAKFGALTQIARAEGGAPSAAEAARSVVGFGNTLKKSARISAFQDVGVDVFTDEKKTKLKDPFQLIRESLTATGGNLQEMNKLFMDVIGGRTVAGLTGTFNTAGGGQAGIDAVNKKLDKFTKDAFVSQEEIAESNRRRMETAAAKAQKFQNQLDRITESVAEKLLPALEKAGPDLLKFAQALGSATTWVIENPKKAIAVALGASIARAGIESVFRAGIERAILGSVVRPPIPLPAGGAAPGAGGAAAGGLGVGAVAAGAAAAVGVGLALDQGSKLAKETGGESSLLDVLPGFRKGSFSFEEWAENMVFSPMEGLKKSAGAGADFVRGLDPDVVDARMNATAKREAKEREASKGVENKLDSLNQKLSGTLNVNVTSMPALPAPPSGREPSL